MSYKCKQCGAKVPPNQPLKKITKFRTVRVALDSERMRREIESETPVCDECFKKYSEQALADKFKNG